MHMQWRIASLVLMICLLTSSASGAWAGSFPDRAHRDMTMQETESLRFDLDRFADLCARIESETKKTDSALLPELLQQLRDEYLIQDTLLTTASIQSDLDVTDQAANDRYLTLYQESYDVDDLMRETVQAVRSSRYADLIDPEDLVYSLFLEDAPPIDDETWAIYEEEQILLDQYDILAGETYTALVDGKEYTEDALYDAYMQGEISWETYDSGALMIAEAQNKALAPIYLDLLENRRTQAQIQGYDDYVAFQDNTTYYRDYTRSEIGAFSDAVKRYIVPIQKSLEEAVDASSQNGAYDSSFSQEELLTLLREGLSGVSDAMLPALDYMENNGYCNLESLEFKYPGAYTTLLSYPNAPFLLMSPMEDHSDFTTLVHEFGHYNAYYTAKYPWANNLDLSEIHSQALELLMMDYYETPFAVQADPERLYTLYSVVTSLLDGCMFDELERYAYTTRDLTVEELNKKYLDLLKDYGYRDSGETGEAYSWVTITHLYSQPLYYLSYAVSAAGALSIWEQSLYDRSAGVDTYLELVSYGEGDDFFATLTKVGMGNPISESSVAALAETVKAYMEPRLPEKPSYRLSPVLLTAIGAVVFADILIICVIAFIYRRRREEYDES